MTSNRERKRQLSKQYEKYLHTIKDKSPKNLAKIMVGESDIESSLPKDVEVIAGSEKVQSPKAAKVKKEPHRYIKAQQIRSKSFGDLVSEKLVDGESIGQSFKKSFVEKKNATLTGLKEKFDPMNIAKKLTGGSNIAPALIGRLRNRSQEDIEYFSGKKKEEPEKRKPLEVDTEKGIDDITSKDTLSDALGKLYTLMKNNIDEEKTIRELNRDKTEDEELNKQNDELIGAFEKAKKKQKKEKPEEKEKKEKEKEEKAAPGKRGTARKAEKVRGPKAKERGPSKGPSASKETPSAKPPSGAKPSATKTPTGGGGGGGSAAGTLTAAAAGAVGGGLAVAAAVIAKEEGLPKGGKAYWDPPNQKNLVSIGYGHQIKDFEYKQGFIQAGNEQIPIKGNRGIDTVMTKDQSQQLLQQDLPKYEERARKPLGDSWQKLNDQQKSALISYAYNTGSTASLAKQGIKGPIDAGDTAGAAAIIRDRGIRTAGGQVNPVLVKRRAEEAALFEAKELKAATATPASVPPKAGEKVAAASTENKDLRREEKEKNATPVVVNNNNTNVTQGGTKQTNMVIKPNDKPVAMQAQNG
jgi:hypothetical protein